MREGNWINNSKQKNYRKPVSHMGSEKFAVDGFISVLVLSFKGEFLGELTFFY